MTMTAETPALAATSTPDRSPPTPATVWVGRGLSALPMLALSLDALIKIANAPPAVEGTTKLGFAASVVRPMGLLELALIVLYLAPRTAVLGAVLWTGYFGGAVCIHVLRADPVLTHLLSPVYASIFVWGGLWLRDSRVRALLRPAS